MKEKIGFLDLLQTVAIIFGIVFGLLEVSQMRAERSRQAAVELARSFQTPSLMEGVTTSLRMPDGVWADEVLHSFGGRDHRVLEQDSRLLGVLAGGDESSH